MDHASVTVAANGTATLLGPGVNITAGAGASVTAGGNGQSASDQDLGTVNANGGTVTLADNSRENVYETGGSIISGNHVNFGAIGSGMNVTCPSTSNLWVGDDGRANPVLNVVHASDSNVTVLDNSWVNVYDTGGVITGGMHDSFGALGTNITINCPVNSSSGVWIGAAGTSSSVSDKFVGQGIGSGSNITLMNDTSNTALSVQGTGVTMYGLRPPRKTSAEMLAAE